MKQLHGLLVSYLAGLLSGIPAGTSFNANRDGRSRSVNLTPWRTVVPRVPSQGASIPLIPYT